MHSQVVQIINKWRQSHFIATIGKGRRQVSHFKKLEYLDVSNSKADNDFISILASNCTQIQYIQVNQICWFDLIIFFQVSECIKQRRFRSRCLLFVRRYELSWYSGCKQLESFYARGTPITESVILTAIQRLKNLKIMDSKHLFSVCSQLKDCRIIPPTRICFLSLSEPVATLYFPMLLKSQTIWDGQS